MSVSTSSPRKSHAVVVGGSIAGLAVARVLADHFDQVTLVERDPLADSDDSRPGVPQGRQLHILLRRGLDIYETLFPGLRDELIAAGGEMVAWGRDVRWYHFGGWKRRNQSTFDSLFCSRLLLEGRLRRRLAANPRVTMRDHALVTGLILDESKRRVRAVTVEPREGGQGRPVEVQADLVVDASGRGSSAPAWLEAHGYTPPVETVVNSKLGYATRYFRRRHDVPDWKVLVVHATPPASSRLGALVPIEGDRWQVVLGGVNCDYPPTDEASFMEYARSLASTELYEALRHAEPLSPIYGFRRTENRLRHYDRLPRHLEGFVALGDAVAAFNPVYGQGMSTAAAGAELLGRCLREAGGQLDGLPRTFQKRLARQLITPWFLATSEDFRYPTTEGERPTRALSVIQGFLDRILALSTIDQRAYDAFVSVMHMTRLPTVLLHPAILAGALSGRSANLAAHTTAVEAGWSMPPVAAKAAPRSQLESLSG